MKPDRRFDGSHYRSDLHRALGEALVKRAEDWQRSFSESYAGPPGSDGWMNGLLSYLLQGPGALLPTVEALIYDALTPKEK